MDVIQHDVFYGHMFFWFSLYRKLDGLLDSNPLSLPPQALRRQSSGTASGYSRKGSAASLSSVSGGERDRRSRTAALLLDDEAEAGTSAGQPSGSSEDTSTTAAIVHAQSESPVLMIRSRTNNRQVKSALENLRQADDDLFELWPWPWLYHEPLLWNLNISWRHGFDLCVVWEVPSPMDISCDLSSK